MFHQDIQTPRSGLKKQGTAEFFLTELEVFGYLMKHSFEFLIWLLKPFIILGEIQSKSLQNFMLIKIWFPNLCHGSDFLCFLYELLMNLRNCFEYPKNPYLNRATHTHAHKTLAKFSYPKKSRNRKFQTQKNPSIISIT